MSRLSDIEMILDDHDHDRPALLREGVALYGTAGASGAEMLAWLTTRGVSDSEARQICADLIRASRPVSDRPDGLLPADLALLRRVDAGHFAVRSPSENFKLTGPEFISMADADRLGRLREAGHTALADYSPNRTWPQPYVLTASGREAVAE